ncbi:ankyrin [Periconia macrospinosa]|uniref:Ankyrin n=1 Tax=Periconia macrospinosa TaxID=97972 RepID=A0A2V1DJD0_9PLEO|nr:ankyrin [Periconia macrospinosa]
MHLFDFPEEMFSKIILHASLARGVKRALRLRLVCKRFSQALPRALFESRLLDAFNTEKILSDWVIENDHGATKLWHSYLVYRVHNEIRQPCQRRYVELRLVAQRVCEETGADMETTIEALCWPALKQCTIPDINSKLEKEPLSPNLDLLCAAAYLNHIAVAQRLLREGYSPHTETHLFLSPMELAAWAGNTQLLQMFQQNVPELEGFDPARLNNPAWRGKVGPTSIRGAAARGDIEMVRLAIYPPSRAAPENTDFVDQFFGSVARSSCTGVKLSIAQSATREIEVYKYLERFFSKPADFSRDLVTHARLGNLEMVRYLLDAGADTRGVYGRHDNPLAEACRRCHEDVVDLLLDRGADPNFHGDENVVAGPSAMHIAAASGSLAMVYKLIARGGDLFFEDFGIEMGFPALHSAVQLENTEMVKYLVAAGVNLTIYGETILRLASLRGLDSMVEVLQGEGVSFGLG